MSLQLFIVDICSEPLTKKRLSDVFEFNRLQNKSPLIDPLTNILHKQLENSATKENISLEEVCISPDITSRVCKRFRDMCIKKSIESTEPLLEPMPKAFDGYGSHMHNPCTNLIFKRDEEGKRWVATNLYRSGKLYPLKKAHISICISNGWYFESDILDIDCPFKVK